MGKKKKKKLIHDVESHIGILNITTLAPSRETCKWFTLLAPQHNPCHGLVLILQVLTGKMTALDHICIIKLLVNLGSSFDGPTIE